MSVAERLLILGGTFDPLHNGHLSIARQVSDALGARCTLVVASTPPLRPEPAASPRLRLEMARAGAAGTSLEVSDMEVVRGGTSYTLDTYLVLAKMKPDADIVVILGADAARTVQHWHRAPELLGQASFALVNRSGTPRLDVREAAQLGFRPERTRLVTVQSPDVSATEVRRRAAAGEAVAELVPAAVEALISRHGLYGFHNREPVP